MNYYLFTDESFELPKCIGSSNQFVYFTKRAIHKSTPNEDALLIIEINPSSCIFAVADGAGGHPKGEEAAQICLEEIVNSIKGSAPQDSYRTEILNAIEKANNTLLQMKTGSKTTLSVLEYNAGICRNYQVGDSTSIICGQKGKLKFRSTSHSPVGYGVEAGLIDEDEALKHPDLNIISNLIGDNEMKIEIGPEIKVSKNDSLLIASDGLFDNYLPDDVVDMIRSGPLFQASQNLMTDIQKNIYGNKNAKQDDLTFVLLRPPNH